MPTRHQSLGKNDNFKWRKIFVENKHIQFLFPAKKYNYQKKDSYLNVVWFCFISVWIGLFCFGLVNIRLGLIGQGELANQIFSVTGGSRMVFIWLNPASKLVTLGHTFAVSIQTCENISEEQRMISSLCKNCALWMCKIRHIVLPVSPHSKWEWKGDQVLRTCIIRRLIWEGHKVLLSSELYGVSHITKAVLYRMGNTWSSPESRPSLQRFDFLIKL